MTFRGGSFISTAVSQWEMVVTKQQDQLTLSVRGPETQASPAPEPEDAEFFVIVFRHGVFMPQLPKSELVEDAIRGLPLYLSQRSIQRRFLHVTGLTYKTIQQIERARQESSLLQGGNPITEAAYQTGYFDQAHLTNALKRFYGQTPAQIANQTGVFFQDESSLKLYNQVNNSQKENR